jgi:hypothetical protein
LREATCREISRLVAEGASLDVIEAYIEERTRGLSEEQLSAAWLRDWLFLEHPEMPDDLAPQPLE